MPTDDASRILDDQVIHIKRGRFHSFGYEPCWNVYFDFYISPKYIDPPLIKLEDMGLHLYLRKNINDQNPNWKMPTIQQMMGRLDVSYSRLSAMMERLEKAHLVTKESGVQKGTDGENVRNEYLVSDPIQTLAEFLLVASAGVFERPLKAEWLDKCTGSVHPYRGNRDTPIAEIAIDQQTSFLKQTGDLVLDDLWSRTVEALQTHAPSQLLQSFLGESGLVSIEATVATITTPKAWAVDWISTQMGKQIGKVMNTELRIMQDSRQITEVLCVVESSE